MSARDDECDIKGHDERVTYEDAEVRQFECSRCGAELEDEIKEPEA